MNQYILIYRGFGRSPGWCHVVIAEDESAVLVGELDDNPGTTVTNALEQVAESINSRLLKHQADIELYEYVPKGLPELEPTFYRIAWRGGHRFSMPEWNVLADPDGTWLRNVKGLVMDRDYTSKALLANRKLPVVDAREPDDLPVAI